MDVMMVALLELMTAVMMVVWKVRMMVAMMEFG
jgi:hypothetical protein